MSAIGTSVTTKDGNIRFAVVIDDQEQMLYRRPWDGKIFVVGIPDKAFTLTISNQDNLRVEVVSSVDGMNTQKDEIADLAVVRGAVINPHARATIAGWRADDTSSNKFVFGTPEVSIAGQATGATSNVGVIGFAVFRELVLPRQDFHFGGYGYRSHTQPYGGRPQYDNLKSDYRSAPSAAPATYNEDVRSIDRSAFAPNLGTTIGETQHDPAGSKTTFTRSPHVDPELIIIGYDTEEALKRMGVIAPPEPQAFPKTPTGYGKYQPR
jgi:hypothetical protein